MPVVLAKAISLCQCKRLWLPGLGGYLRSSFCTLLVTDVHLVFLLTCVCLLNMAGLLYVLCW